MNITGRVVLSIKTHVLAINRYFYSAHLSEIHVLRRRVYHELVCLQTVHPEVCSARQKQA